MLDVVLHKWLHLPYVLHVQIVKPVSKPTATVLFIHGIGTSSAAWDQVIAGLPNDVEALAVDLLGFGKSPRPGWASYDTKTQARALLATVSRQFPRQRLILVGHSLGALVAVEFTKRYPWLVESLILCSPPFYADDEARSVYSGEARLKQMYKLISRHPEEFVTVSAMAIKLGIINKEFAVDEENVSSYMAALNASIINQTALSDAQTIKKPMTIIHGSFDLVVINKHLKQLAQQDNVKLKTILAGHEIRGRYVSTIIAEIENSVRLKPEANVV
jgi:pimeloyl-ACP methyl ester carboxylesterase